MTFQQPSALIAALNVAETSPTAAIALGELPDPDAQRSLAGLVLDSSRPALLRRQSATELVHSVERFGPLLSAQQEASLVPTARQEDDPDVRASLEAVVRALRRATRSAGSPAPPPAPVPAQIQR